MNFFGRRDDEEDDVTDIDDDGLGRAGGDELLDRVQNALDYMGQERFEKIARRFSDPDDDDPDAENLRPLVRALRRELSSDVAVQAMTTLYSGIGEQALKGEVTLYGDAKLFTSEEAGRLATGTPAGGPRWKPKRT
jgi:hypothetical protein